jgi:CRP-like cAMP-binding protein
MTWRYLGNAFSEDVMKSFDPRIFTATLLQELDQEDIQKYLKDNRFMARTFVKDAVIHFEDEPCLQLEVIVSGEIVVERIDESGRLLTVAEFRVNDILGGNIVFSKTPRYPMTITAKQTSVILGIDKELLFELFCVNPAFLRRFLEYISDHSTILSFKIRNAVDRTIRESVLRYLEQERKKQNTNRIKLSMTKKALADRMGVQRTSLSRELSKMKKDGIVDFDTDSITIL